MWGHPHLKFIRSQLADVTLGRCRKLAIAWPPQHYKTWSTTVRYPLWRMLREPGLRVGVGTYNQRYANKISRWTRRLLERVGVEATGAVDSWALPNGSSYIARGAGVGLAGEPVDLWVCDDPFKNREQADSATVQEKVWEWHMDDVTPRIQQGGEYILIHTRWNAGDLIGRVLKSEDKAAWRFVRLPAVAESQADRDRVHERLGLPVGEPDPIDRAAGDPLCPAAFDADALADKRRVLGVGFESLYQQDEVPRGGSFFQRDWFKSADAIPAGARLVRYWDLACLVAGTMIETRDGPRPIESVQPGDYVLTRSGFKRVLNAWLTKHVKRVTTVTFSNGSRIAGTDDHLVWTENRGWVELGSLTSNDYNTSITKEGYTWRLVRVSPVSRTRSASSSMASRTHAVRGGSTSRRTAGTRSGSGTTPSRCTKRFGSTIAGRSPTATTCITLMATTTTTQSTTLSCSPAPSTRVATTRLRLSTAPSGLKNTTAESLKPGGLTPFTSSTCAPTAATNSSPGADRQSSVPTVAAGFTATTSDGTAVYDLEVEDAHEFFANGVLVHNSSRKDSACFTSGVLMGAVGAGEAKRYVVADVVRGRWSPADRNEVMLQTARADATRPGFERTWFEEPVFDKDRSAMRGIMAQLSGFPVAPDNVGSQGSKELRAEPMAAAAKAGLVSVVAGPWVGAWLTEVESFPRGQWKDQVDSSTGAFNKLSRGGGAWAVSG